MNKVVDLTKFPNTYIYQLAQKQMLDYLVQVANEQRYTTPIITFYDAVVEAVQRAPQTGRTKTFLKNFADKIRNTKTSAQAQARQLLRIIARCQGIDPSTYVKRIDPKTVDTNLLTDPEKKEITLDEQLRKEKYEAVNLFVGLI